MSPLPLQRLRGTVSLVALCFVAVLGIVLASYLSICSRAMNLSNRSYQAGVAQQLAEFGLEEGLRAFNKNSWSGWASNPTGITGATSAWTLDTTNHRANRTITFGAGKLGQGTTATVKIRVDNYDANVLGAAYSSSATYRVNDLVGSGGTWYRCVLDGTTNVTPGGSDYASWVPVPIEWAWTSSRYYRANYDVVSYGGNWWLCNTNHTSSTTFGWSNWSWIPTPKTSWNASTWYDLGALVFRANVWYRCTTAHNSSTSFDSAKFTTASWSYQSGVTYAFDDVVMSSAGTWYRYINPTPTSGNAPAVNSYWEYARSGTMFGWSSAGVKYELGDTVYSSSTGFWYRCILAHTSSTSFPVTNTSYWSDDPAYSPFWNASRNYSQNDTVYHKGAWYLSLANSNTNQNPATATTYWIGANTTNSSYIWNSTTSYAANNLRCYGGVWYKCLVANTNKSPNDTTYWTPTWTGAMGVTSGGAVIYAEASVAITGSPSVRTQLRAAINPAPLFPNALGATDAISLGAGGTIDSYDSISDLNASTKGYSAVVASAYTTNPAVYDYGAKIQGYVSAPSASTSPYAPLVSFGSNAEVKGTAATPSPTKADPTRISRSPSIPQFAPLPSASGGLSGNWSTTPKGTAIDFSTFAAGSTVNLGTAGSTTASRYNCSNLTVDGSPISRININGPVILYVQGNLLVGGSTDNSAHRIVVTAAGSAEIHVGGRISVNLTSGGFENVTKDPKKLTIIADTTGGGVLNYSDGDTDFYGTIYAPYTTNSDGVLIDNSNVQIFGAISAKKITSSNDTNLHYDTSLRYAQIPGVDQPYSITSWRVLPQAEQATMP